MESGTTAVDIPHMISDMQRLVVYLKEEGQLVRAVSTASALRESIRGQLDCGLSSLKPRTPLFGSTEPHLTCIEKPGNNGQLRELDAENRHLRSLYEDTQWTLHLVMQQHRRAIEKLCSEDRASTSTTGLAEQEDEEKSEIYEKFVGVAQGINKVMQAEEKKQAALSTEIEDLALKNALLREMLNSDLRELDIETLLDKIENKTPLATPNTSVIYVPPAPQDETEDADINILDPKPSCQHAVATFPAHPAAADSDDFVPEF